MGKIKKYLPAIILILFELAVGIMMLVDPQGFAFAVFTVFGVILMIIGVIQLVRFVGDKRNDAQTNLTLISAIFALIFGAAFAFGTALIIGMISAIAIIYGVIALISGFIKIADFANRPGGAGHSVMTLISGILSVALGVILLINPFGTSLVLWQVTGVMLIIEAVADVISVIIAARIASKVVVEVVATEVDTASELPEETAE